MSKQETGITWTNTTWNPVTGCSKVSAGCANCYAERDWARLANNPKLPDYQGRKFTDIMCHDNRLDQPIRWTRPRMIFVNSMSDLFHEDVPFEFIDKVFAVMAATPHHTYQILTERPERMKQYILSLTEQQDQSEMVGHYFGSDVKAHTRSELIAEMALSMLGRKSGMDNVVWESPEQCASLNLPLKNVWLGVTAENQETADGRIPILLNTPAALRFVSIEPMVGPINLDMMITENTGDRFRVIHSSLMGKKTLWDTKNLIGEEDINKLDWVICGGESGPKARPIDPEWVKSLRDQCEFTNTPFFFKQWGEYIDLSQITSPDLQIKGNTYSMLSNGALTLWRCGKRAAGNMLDGEIIEMFPSLPHRGLA